jgi:hypothetical protein
LPEEQPILEELGKKGRYCSQSCSLYKNYGQKSDKRARRTFMKKNILAYVLVFNFLNISCAVLNPVSESPEQRFETPQNIVKTDKGNVVFNFVKWKKNDSWKYGLKVMWFDAEGIRVNRPDFKQDGLEFKVDYENLKLSQLNYKPNNYRSVASVDEVWSTENAEFNLNENEAFELSKSKSVKFVLKGKNFDVAGEFGPEHLRTMQDFLVARVEK